MEDDNNNQKVETRRNGQRINKNNGQTQLSQLFLKVALIENLFEEKTNHLFFVHTGYENA
jgi:hypothetical protein